jgi:hypothetical protein
VPTGQEVAIALEDATFLPGIYDISDNAGEPLSGGPPVAIQSYYWLSPGFGGSKLYDFLPEIGQSNYNFDVTWYPVPGEASDDGDTVDPSYIVIVYEKVLIDRSKLVSDAEGNCE